MCIYIYYNNLNWEIFYISKYKVKYYFDLKKFGIVLFFNKLNHRFYYYLNMVSRNWIEFVFVGYINFRLF